MSYKTLYRTYRPQNFSDVVGQEHITKTFMNALKNDKIAHAYLFTGPRGTGKTTIAKIIAKAVNCQQAPISDPCNQCHSCTSINSGFDSDVFEIDAASNNGVDEIREIRDKVKYAPTVGRYKVYIIDEVHMLSTGAFNALLKTLEEPPKHVIFILATTEPHKIPATIISRCQRFDFKSISINDIIYRIKQIVDYEKIKIEENAITAVAKNAQGGMRDALSLLDQAISYSDDIVTEENVHEITGTVSEDNLAIIVESIISCNPEKAIEFIDRLISRGKEPLRLVENLIYYFRDLFLIKKLREINKQIILYHNENTIALAKMIDETKLYEVITILNNTQYEMRKTNYPRVFIELAMFNIVEKFKSNNIINEPKIVKEVKELEPKTMSIKQEVEVVKNNNDDIEYKYIDVRLIEEVLNNASKDKKTYLASKWKFIYGNDISNVKIEQLLIDGSVEAVSNDNKILLSYQYDTVCAKLYEPDVYKKALEILFSLFNEEFEIIAVTKKIWDEKREEFVEQFRNKIKYPKLSPINEPLIIKKQTNKYEFEPEIVKEAINLFGEDIIDIKK